jgi:hypothetical protein
VVEQEGTGECCALEETDGFIEWILLFNHLATSAAVWYQKSATVSIRMQMVRSWKIFEDRFLGLILYLKK